MKHKDMLDDLEIVASTEEGEEDKVFPDIALRLFAVRYENWPLMNARQARAYVRLNTWCEENHY